MGKIIAIGASLGGFDLFKKFLPELPVDYPWPITIVQHRIKTGRQELTDLLQFTSTIRVKEAEDKEEPKPGTVYFAPANYHLLIGKDRRFALDSSEKVNYSRPSIDVFFESAAEAIGNDLVAILLTGANHDGAEGLRMAKAMGGTVIAQNPSEAVSPQMPQAGIAAANPEMIYTIREITEYLLSII